MKKIIILIILFLVLLPAIATAQDSWNSNKKIQVIVGVNALWEGVFAFSKGNLGFVNAGYYAISAETRFTRHSGLEIDLATRGSANSLNIPIMYKYYSKILNFTVGINAIIPLSKSNTGVNVAFAPEIRITKDIRLYKGLFAEPQIAITSLYSQGIIIGCGLGLKYRL